MTSTRSTPRAAGPRRSRSAAIGSSRSARRPTFASGWAPPTCSRGPASRRGSRMPTSTPPSRGGSVGTSTSTTCTRCRTTSTGSRAHAAAHPDDAWIVGGGWYMPVFGGDQPHRRQLDALVPDRPVYLMNTDTHAAWVNTKALELAGITADTPDPWDGYFVRDDDGPTGLLQEGTAYTFWSDHVPPDSTEDWMASIRVAQEYLHALGITAWQDAWVRPDLLRGVPRVERRRGAHRACRHRAVVGPPPRRGADRRARRAARLGDEGPGRRAARSRSCSTAAPRARPARCSPPTKGTSARSTAAGSSSSRRVRSARRSSGSTRSGSRSTSTRSATAPSVRALDAVEAARSANGWNDARHHIAHLQLPDPADIAASARSSGSSPTSSRCGPAPIR